VWAGALGCWLMAMAPRAQGQPYWNANTSLTNLPVNLETHALSNLTSQPITIRPGYSLGVQFNVGATNTATNGVVARVNLSVDGTNWTSSTSFWLQVPSADVGGRWFTNIPPSAFEAARFFRITSVSNAHGDTLWVTNIIISRFNR
jgi:hypothetical protein